jgi:hypothetical protein
MTSQPTADDYTRAQQLIDGIRRRGAQVEGVAVVIAAIRAEGREAGVHEGRSDALDVIERMIESDDPGAIVDALPRAEA